MIILHPYISECQAYNEMPEHYRWIFSKLSLYNALAQDIWPVGVWVPPGDYCLRPIANIGGMAGGGFKKVTLTKPRNIVEGPAGYCLTPWTDEFRCWHLFINDKCIFTQSCVRKEGEIEYYAPIGAKLNLPRVLRGISRYLLVETLGETIIDVGPRHMVEEMRQDVIDDYRQIDPDYQPPSYGKFGIQPTMRVYEEDGWYKLGEIENDRSAA